MYIKRDETKACPATAVVGSVIPIAALSPGVTFTWGSHSNELDCIVESNQFDVAQHDTKLMLCHAPVCLELLVIRGASSVPLCTETYAGFIRIDISYIDPFEQIALIDRLSQKIV